MSDTTAAAVAPDNPFAKYAQKPANDNPFAKYAQPTPDTTSDEVPPEKTFAGGQRDVLYNAGQLATGAIAGLVGAPADMIEWARRKVMSGVYDKPKQGETYEDWVARNEEQTAKPSVVGRTAGSEAIGNAIAGPAQSPEDTENRAAGAQLTSGARLPFNRPPTASATAGGDVVGAIGRSVEGLSGRLSGKSAAEAVAQSTAKAEALRGETLAGAKGAAGEQEAAATTAEQQAKAKAAPLTARAGQLEQTAQQIRAKQPGVAAEREAAQAPGKALAQGRAVAENPETVRAADAHMRAVQQRQAEATAMRRQEEAAGATRKQANDLVLEREGRLREAETVAANLDAEIAARPTMDKETFGERIRSIAQSLNDRLKQVRAREAKYGETLAAAGADPRVNTQGIADYTKSALESSRNPATQRILAAVNNLITTETEKGAENKLSLTAADDLRKTISSWIETGQATTKEGAPLSVQAAQVAALKPIRKELTRQAIEAWPDYARALERHSTLSRPLNVLSRNAGLGKIIDRNPATTEYKRDLGDVVGEVIKRANKGNKALDALLDDSPELKESARLYFAKQLFSERAPTQAQISSFLRSNESALRKFGLYDEFKNIKSARAAAKQAIDEATGAYDLSIKEAKAAEAREKALAKQVEAAEARVAKQRNIKAQIDAVARKRAGEHPDATVESRTVGGKPDTSLKRTENAKQAAKRLETEAEKQRKSAEKLLTEGSSLAAKGRALADDFRKIAEKIEKPEALPTKDVPDESLKLIDKLRDNQMLTKEQYQTALTKIQAVKAEYERSAQALADQKALRTKVKHVMQGLLYAAAVPLLGYAGYKVVKGIARY